MMFETPSSNMETSSHMELSHQPQVVESKPQPHLVRITNVVVHNNPTSFQSPFQFEITFECDAEEELKEDLEFKIVYVGSAEKTDYDQVLDSIMVGPVVKGTQKVLFQAPAPDIKNIPPNDVLGVTVCLLTVHYKNNEFVRVGYYVNIEYDEEELRTNPPETIQIERLQRNILAEKPRVTRWAIQWDD